MINGVPVIIIYYSDIKWGRSASYDMSISSSKFGIEGIREHDRGSSKTYLTIDRAPGAYLRKGYRREWMNWRLWLSKKRIIWKKRIKNNKNLQRQISSQNREGSVFSFAIFEKIMYNRKISGLKADRREERRQVGLWIFDCQ